MDHSTSDSRLSMASQPSRENKEKKLSSVIYESDEDDLNNEYEDISDSDGDLPLLEGFNEIEAKLLLFNFKKCSQIVLSSEHQKALGLLIGVNITAEHPWKQIKKEVLFDYLADDAVKFQEFRKKFSQLDDDDLILVGYAPALSEDDDVFMFFENEDIAKEASEIIEKIEANERRKAKKALVKRPRRWKSYGSEKEVDLYVLRTDFKIIDVEVQSLYPINYPHKPFEQRLVNDARDGYVELLPKKMNFNNINRKRVNIAVQSAPKLINLEQQTEPTFPANAWSQYLYEIVRDEKAEAEEEAAQEAAKPKIKVGAKIPTPEPVIPSNQAQELLDTLEFNEVDMYRNDYPFIAKKPIQKFKIPYFTESFCFADISKSNNRYVGAIDWHPTQSGLVLVSYTFTTLCTTINNKTNNVDVVKRVVTAANPVLLWSFDDTLYPKLELDTPREITCLSFCPYDENLVVGGTINGQLVIWDLKNRLKYVETEEILSASQRKYRSSMRSFLSWTKEDNQNRIVRPVAITALEESHKGPILSIKWLDRKHYVAETGNVRRNPNLANNAEERFRFFVTASLGGSIAFWDLDCKNIGEAKRKNPVQKIKIPADLLPDISDYEYLSRDFRPSFMLVYNRPITNIIIDQADYKYFPINVPKHRKLQTRVKHETKEYLQDEFQTKITISSLFGTLANVTWHGSSATITGNDIRKESIQQPEMFDNVHLGPILNVDCNPFLPQLFLSIGKKIVALWTEELMWSPIIWRRRTANLTHCKWSTNRPSVFFLLQDDGSLEAWDLLNRTDEPCLVHSLGGNILTLLSQHKLSLTQEAIIVGDYNSSLRLLLIPPSLAIPLPNECEILKDFIKREVDRKVHLNNCQTEYYAANEDVREAKRKTAQEAQNALERLEKEQKDKEDLRIRKEEEELRRAKLREKNNAVYDLPERLEQKWDDMNIKRLMKVLMNMKQIDPELLAMWTKPEKDRIEYGAKKRQAIAESFRKVNEDVVNLRARLLPIENTDEDRVDVIKQNLSNLLMTEDDELIDYNEIEKDALEYKATNNQRKMLEFSEILTRGQQRREVINRSLGSNTLHRDNYAKIRKRKLPEISKKIPAAKIAPPIVRPEENIEEM